MIPLLSSTLCFGCRTGIAAGTGAVIVWIVILVMLASLIYIGFFVWWIILLIDCVNRDFEEKSVWLLVLILSFIFGFIWLADILYYFMVVKKFNTQAAQKSSKSKNKKTRG